MAIDPRFLAESGFEVFSGNELLVKGALETDGGVHLLTGYPGSPVAGFFDTITDIAPLLKEKGIRAFQANNEALGAAAVNGSQMLPCRAIAAMKSVGVHVASDALALGNLAGANPQGGALIVMGDDPWCESTQVAADSRFLCEHLRMPVVEPGTPQELKDWVNLSFRLSQAAGLYIGFIVTVAHADGGGTVRCKPNQFPAQNANNPVSLQTSAIDLDKVLLPPRTWRQELKMPARYALTMQAARELGINRITPSQWEWTNNVAPYGFIVTGMGGPYLRQVLSDIGMEGAFPILHMGMSYPPDAQLAAEFAKSCQSMIVIEERRSFLEKNLRDAFYQTLAPDQATNLSARLFGKRFPVTGAASAGANSNDADGIPDMRGLNYSVLAQKLIPLLQVTPSIPPDQRNGRLSAELERLRNASRPKLAVFNNAVVLRTPTFCPGCPHRDSSSTLLEVRKNLADPKYMALRHPGHAPVDLVAHGDTGCYTMLMYPPTQQLMHNYSGMGLGGGTGGGIDPFITNKQLVFMGDGTFFHSGAVAITNSVKSNQDITFIILENKTTAMTGHQEHAGTELDLLGDHCRAQDIERIVRGISGITLVARISPADRARYKETLEGALLADGVKVVIADKECGITFHRTRVAEERKKIKEFGYLPSKQHMNITPEVCENCLECTKATACPGLTSIDTDYGKKIDTDLTWCVNDGACERVRASNEIAESVKPCPSFEQVTVIRSKRRRYTLPQMNLDKLPEPVVVHDMTVPSAAWRVHMSGVGGMGIGVVGAIVVRAGHKEGYRVVFQDKKGLAIRNGGVFSQITFLPGNGENAATGSIPYGKADLLLGIDILEAARAIDPREGFRVASAGHTSAVLNTHKQATVNVLLGASDFDPDVLRERIMEVCDGDKSFAKNLSTICEQRLGSKQFVNIMMLGVAYQLGLIPVSARSIAWGIKDTIRREHRRNVKAFNIGRKLALEPRALPNKPAPVTWEQLLTNKSRILKKTRWLGRGLAGRYEMLVKTAVRNMRGLGDVAKYDLTLRIYDLIQYQDLQLAKRYVDLIRNVYRRDQESRQFAATATAIVNLAKVMLIKDEPYVSYLLTRYEKKQRDLAKFGIDQANGDRLVYHHHTSPEFNIGKHRIRMKLTTTDWQLKLVSHMKWWRKLPGWHMRECAFRDWYIELLDRVAFAGDEQYATALRALRCPENVSGYREVRYPKMDAARAMAEGELNAPVAPVAAQAAAPVRESQPARV
jgi:indolepyruvate ferredoxin oxidoreductase